MDTFRVVWSTGLLSAVNMPISHENHKTDLRAEGGLSTGYYFVVRI